MVDITKLKKEQERVIGYDYQTVYEFTAVSDAPNRTCPYVDEDGDVCGNTKTHSHSEKVYYKKGDKYTVNVWIDGEEQTEPCVHGSEVRHKWWLD